MRLDGREQRVLRLIMEFSMATSVRTLRIPDDVSVSNVLKQLEYDREIESFQKLYLRQKTM